jgi:hypothetical protein
LENHSLLAILRMVGNEIYLCCLAMRIITIKFPQC